MIRFSVLASVLLCVLGAHSSVLAQALEKPDGYACIPEICIGDGLHEVRKLKFEQAKENRLDSNGEWIPGLAGVPTVPSKAILPIEPNKPLNSPYLGYSFPNYRGSDQALKAASNYLTTQKFDNKALDILVPELVVCPELIALHEGLIGRFVSLNGTKNIIEIQLVPDEKGTGQSWKVTHITRVFPDPGPMSSSQLNEVKEKLKTMYPSTFDKVVYKGNSLVRADPIATRHKLDAYGKLEKRLHSKDAYLANPLCASKKLAF